MSDSGSGSGDGTSWTDAAGDLYDAAADTVASVGEAMNATFDEGIAHGGAGGPDHPDVRDEYLQAEQEHNDKSDILRHQASAHWDAAMSEMGFGS